MKNMKSFQIDRPGEILSGTVSGGIECIDIDLYSAMFVHFMKCYHKSDTQFTLSVFVPFCIKEREYVSHALMYYLKIQQPVGKNIEYINSSTPTYSFIDSFSQIHYFKKLFHQNNPSQVTNKFLSKSRLLI